MVRISPLVGRHVVEQQFLPRFCDLCSESLFHIRKVCAVSIGAMCRVVGPNLAEIHLLPKFFNLCEDGIWGVRKACTECFMEVSNSLSPMARRNELAQLFVGLLCDQSRWVRMSAFQALGPFISTFADPDMTGLYFDQDGILRVCEKEASNQSLRLTNKTVDTTSIDASSVTTSSIDSGQIDSTENAQLQSEQREVNTSAEPAEPADASAPVQAGEVDTEGGDATVQAVPDSQAKEDSGTIAGPEDSEPIADTDLQDRVSPDDPMDVCDEEKSGEEREEDELESNILRVQVNTSSISPEEVRWKQYSNNTELVYIEGQPETSKLEDFGSFKYWREPVPTLDIQSILQEVTQSEPVARRANVEEEEQREPGGGDKESEPEIDVITVSETENPANTTLESDRLAALVTMTSDITVSEKPSSSESSKSDVAAAPPSAGVGFMFGPTSTPLGSLAAMVAAAPLPPPAQSYAAVLTGTSTVGVHPTSSASHARNISVDSSGDESAITLSEIIAKQQDIIPPLLLENYLSMTDPSRAQTVDSDIAQHCAYSLPAVAYTLGKDNWKCLRSLYQTLVTDMQWKVRRTLAYSIHELAVILGPQLTHSDLIPIFNDFIKDLDEVRIGVLAHLADFVKLLNDDARRSYLTKLPEFLKTDNSRVWRPRLDLAHQLVRMVDLYAAQDVVDYVVPLTMSLLTDTIADVRTASLCLISRILKLLQDSSTKPLRMMLINDLIERLACSSQWHGRQTFVKACHRVLRDGSLERDQFCKELLPSVLTLGEDKIPNVRLAVAELMSQCLLHTEYFTSSDNPTHDGLLQLELKLKDDKDRDVRYYAKLSLQSEPNISRSGSSPDMIHV